MSNFFLASLMSLFIVCFHLSVLEGGESPTLKNIAWPYDEDGNPAEDDGWM